MRAFSGLHPAVQLFCFLSVLSVAVFSSDPVLSMTALLGGMLFSFTLRKKSEVLGDLGFYIPLFFLVAVTNPLFSHNGVTPLFFLNGNPVTLEAVVCGAALAVTVISVMLWCKCFGEVMTSDRLLFLSGSVAPRLGLVLSAALRFIPVFFRQMKRVGSAQKTMGLYSERGAVDRLRSRGRIFLAMLSWSLERSMETASSMRARGYGSGRRTSFSLFRFTPHDAALLVVTAALLGITVAGMATGAAAFTFYPQISMPGVTPLSVATHIAFGILSLLPFALEVWEAILWKYYASRI